MEVGKNMKIKWQDHLNSVWASENCREELIISRDGVQTLFDRLTSIKEVAQVSAPSITEFQSSVPLLPDFETQYSQPYQYYLQVHYDTR